VKYYSPYFGQAYGEGNYSEGIYSCTTEQVANGTCTPASTTTTSGGLANTGIAVVAIVTLACLVVFVSLIVRFWRRKPASKQKASAKNASSSDDRK
jgi:ABC-type multidrug transport system permease subunit